jgi:hypothetical protein
LGIVVRIGLISDCPPKHCHHPFLTEPRGDKGAVRVVERALSQHEPAQQFGTNRRPGRSAFLSRSHRFHYFHFKQDEDMAHCHKRGNVESNFSVINRVFDGSVRSKTDTALKNEVLCKILAANLYCLIHEHEKLGIVPVFWKDAQKSHGVAVKGV